jgi:hypothetical protein
MLPASNGADNVGSAHDTDKRLSTHHRHASDLVRRHEPGDFFDRSFLRDLYYLIAHYGFDLFAFLGDDIGLRNQADDLSLFICYGAPLIWFLIKRSASS